MSKVIATAKRNSPWVNLTIFFVLWIALSGVASLFLYLPFGDILNGSKDGYEKALSTNFIFALCVQLSFTVATISSILLMYKAIDSRKILPIGFVPKVSDSLIGIGIGILIIAAFVLICSVTNQVKIDYHELSNSLAKSFVLFLLVAVSEELLSRGYILNNLLETLKPTLAIIVSSLIFALLHIFNAGVSIVGLANLLLFGVVAALLFFKTKNISMAIGFHFTWNLCQSFMGFAVSGHKTIGLFEVSYLGSELLTGGGFGAEGSVVISALLTIAIVVILFYYRRKDSTPATQTGFPKKHDSNTTPIKTAQNINSSL